MFESLILLDPKDVQKAELLQQTVALSISGQQFQLITLSRFDKQTVRVAAFLPSGQKVMYLEYDGGEFVHEQSPHSKIPAREILAIMQFVHWPSQSVRLTYPERTGWRFEVAGDRRTLAYYDRPILDVSYSEPSIKVDNLNSGYQVLIHTVSVKDI